MAASSNLTETEKDSFNSNEFTVTDEEVTIMIDALIGGKIENESEVHALSRSWIASVMSQPYSKSENERRPFEYSRKKLDDYLRWRMKHNISERVTSHLRGENDEFKDLFEDRSVYWYGVDKHGCPILWCHMNQYNWDNFDPKRKIQFFGIMLSAIYSMMPPGTTRFTTIAIADDVPNKAMMYPTFGPKFAQHFIKSSPDRLMANYFLVSPLGEAIFKVVRPILPKVVRKKINFSSSKKELARKLEEDVLGSKLDLPNFLGGPTIHEEDIICSLPAMAEKISKEMQQAVAPRQMTRCGSEPSEEKKGDEY